MGQRKELQDLKPRCGLCSPCCGCCRQVAPTVNCSEVCSGGGRLPHQSRLEAPLPKVFGVVGLDEAVGNGDKERGSRGSRTGRGGTCIWDEVEALFFNGELILENCGYWRF
jgi:hypothetical protein